MRCVIEVRPFRLLVDCMAAYRCPMLVVSHVIAIGVGSEAQVCTHRFSSSILICKPWAPLALVLFSGGLVVSGGEG